MRCERRAKSACVRTPTGADRGTNAADRLPMSCVLRLAAAVVLWPSVARETNDERRDPWVVSRSRCPDVPIPESESRVRPRCQLQSTLTLTSRPERAPSLSIALWVLRAHCAPVREGRTLAPLGLSSSEVDVASASARAQSGLQAAGCSCTVAAWSLESGQWMSGGLSDSAMAAATATSPLGHVLTYLLAIADAPLYWHWQCGRAVGPGADLEAAPDQVRLLGVRTWGTQRARFPAPSRRVGGVVIKLQSRPCQVPTRPAAYRCMMRTVYRARSSPPRNELTGPACERARARRRGENVRRRRRRRRQPSCPRLLASMSKFLPVSPRLPSPKER